MVGDVFFPVVGLSYVPMHVGCVAIWWW